jgi:hypothetical protein
MYLTMATLASQDEIAHQRNIVIPGNGLLTREAYGAPTDKRKVTFTPKQDYVEEAANNKSKTEKNHEFKHECSIQLKDRNKKTPYTSREFS